MKKWQYIVTSFPYIDDPGLERDLNWAGEEGYELCGDLKFHTGKDGTVRVRGVWKRPKNDDAPPVGERPAQKSSGDFVPAGTSAADALLGQRLRGVRVDAMKEQGCKAYELFNNVELWAIVAKKPQTPKELFKICNNKHLVHIADQVLAVFKEASREVPF